MTALVQALPRPNARAGRLAYDAAAILAGSLLIAGLAQLTIPLPFTPVPVSGQTLGVLLVGTAYGWARGGLTLVLYLAQIAVGLPFAAEGKSGLEVLTVATASGGYLWGFLLASLLMGWLANRGWDRSVRSSISVMLLGSVVIYLVGVPWLMASLDVGLDKGIEFGLAPFVIGDVLKLLVAAGALPLAWRLLGKER